MLYLLISFLSCAILTKSFTSNKILGFWEKLLSSLISRLRKNSLAFSLIEFPLTMSLKKKSTVVSKVENNEEEEGKVSLMDLPDLTLDCILDNLSPADLCNMAAVCASLRDRCRSDYLWERRMERKWGKVIGASAYRQWRWHIASRNREKVYNQGNQKGILASLHGFSPFQWIKTKSGQGKKSRSSLPDDSTMALYLSLENGKFWFPAQVYNREVIRFFQLMWIRTHVSCFNSSY